MDQDLPKLGEEKLNYGNSFKKSSPTPKNCSLKSRRWTSVHRSPSNLRIKIESIKKAPLRF